VILEKVDLRGYVSEPDHRRRNGTARRATDQAFKQAEQAAVYRSRK
jgi:hypothetical protein